jgi:hypothetical protein
MINKMFCVFTSTNFGLGAYVLLRWYVYNCSHNFIKLVVLPSRNITCNRWVITLRAILSFINKNDSRLWQHHNQLPEDVSRYSTFSQQASVIRLHQQLLKEHQAFCNGLATNVFPVPVCPTMILLFQSLLIVLLLHQNVCSDCKPQLTFFFSLVPVHYILI